MDYSARQLHLRQALGVHKLDAILVSQLPNICYLCGFRGSAGVILLTEKQNIFFTDGRYTEQARSEVNGSRVVIARQAPLLAAAEWLAAHSVPKGKLRLGIEASHLTWGAYRRLAAALRGTVLLKAAPPLIEQARMIKDADEIGIIRSAAALGATLFDVALQSIRPGVTQTEVAAKMEFAARKSGAEGMSFPTIIVSGPRSALPHGRPGNTPIRSGEFVVCDFGVILTGYCSDRTRTVFVGRPGREARRIYQAVREAQLAAIQAVRPGRSLGEVDRSARKLLQKLGLSKYFTHSTGHGVGLEIHEAPRVAAREAEVLKPGMVITIEPGVYVPGRWGVRIEDMILVTGSGYEIIAPSSTELMAV